MAPRKAQRPARGLFEKNVGVFGSPLQSVFSVAPSTENQTTPKKITDEGATSRPLALYRHTTIFTPAEIEPYAYISGTQNVPINADCLLHLETSTSQMYLGVRTLKCTCSSPEAITCKSHIPIGISGILYGAIKTRFGSLEDIRVSIQRVSADSIIPNAKQLTIRIVEPDLAALLVETNLSIYTLSELRQVRNIVPMIKSQILTSLVYSLDQIYCFSIGGRLLLISLESFQATGNKAGFSRLFRVADHSFALEIAGAVSQHSGDAAHSPSASTSSIQPKGFQKVGGLLSIKRALEAAIVLPLTRPDLYFDASGALKAIRPPKGVLLYGIPGTGKTFLTQALGEEISLRWQTMNSIWKPPYIQNVDSSFILKGDVAALVGIFEGSKARFENEHRQTLLIFDEIDVLCPKREDASAHSIELTTVFLTHLDGAKSCHGTVIVGTTNRPEVLDVAIRRPGRLDQELEIDVPNLVDRADMILKCAANHQMDGVISSIEIARDLAQDAHGFVPSDVNAWFTKAVQIAQQDFVEKGIFSEPLRVTLAHFKSALISIRPSGLKDFALEIPKVSWTDIGGYDEIKNSLRECIEWPLKYADLFSQMGLSAPRGILLYGPPGNSKTILAKAVASEAKMNFISVKGPEIFSKWVGESEKTIRTIFRKARQHAPTIIFFDEIDALGSDRQSNSKGGSGVEARVLSQMLNEMDGIGASKQVIIIGATNRPDLLDAALMRPGRFDRILYVSLPDIEARKKIFDIHLRRALISSRDEVIASLASVTEGYSGAEIAMICTETRMNAIKKLISVDGYEKSVKDIELTLNDFDEIMSGLKPRTSKELINFYEKYRKG